MRTDLTFNSNTNKQSFGDFGVKELQQGVNISFGNNTFSEKGLVGKTILENEFNWVITDGGL